jgi:hypothetical protein
VKKTALRLGKRLLALSLVAVLVALVACGPSAPATSPTATAKASVPVSPTGPPSKIVVTKPPVTGPPRWGGILGPKDGATINANSGIVAVVLDFSNLNVVAPKDTNVQGEGHILFYLDVDPIPTTAGQKANVLPAGSTGKVYSSTDVQTSSYSWKQLTNGKHIFGAQLVQNDNTPFNPPLFSKITITLEGSTIVAAGGSASPAASPAASPKPSTSPSASPK